MSQFGPTVDKKLDALSVSIGKHKETIEKETAEQAGDWVEVFDVFDEFAREGKAARFIAKDGYILTKQKTQGAPKLDPEKLHDLIFTTYPEAKAKRIWKSITQTTVSVSSLLLEAAIQQKKIDPAIMAQCLTEPDPTYSRIRREWTASDKEKAVVLGITRSEE